jgi:drug/metabolite transporter (DMT)-like permease
MKVKKNIQLQTRPSQVLRNWKWIVPASFILTWSSGAIFVKLGLEYANPFTFVFLRFLLSTALLWGICLTIRSTYPKTVKEWGYIVLTGLLLQAGYQIFYFSALDHHMSPGILAIILGAQPIITAFFGETKTRYYQWFGLFLGLSGLILVVADNITKPNFTLYSLISAILCLVCITIGTFMQKQIQISQPMNMAIQYSGGLLMILMLLPFFGGWHVQWNSTFLLSLFWMAFVISVGASMILYFMIRKGNLTNVTSLLYGVPPVTALLDYIIFKNKLSLVACLGMVFIIVGLFLINRQGKVV